MPDPWPTEWGQESSWILVGFVSTVPQWELQCSILNFLSHLHSVFHSGSTSLHFQQCTRVPFFPHSCRYLLFFWWYLAFWPVRGNILLWFWFVLPWWLATLTIFSCALSHLHVFIGKVLTQVFWPFFWVDCLKNILNLWSSLVAELISGSGIVTAMALVANVNRFDPWPWDLLRIVGTAKKKVVNSWGSHSPSLIFSVSLCEINRSLKSIIYVSSISVAEKWCKEIIRKFLNIKLRNELVYF